MSKVNGTGQSTVGNTQISQYDWIYSSAMDTMDLKCIRFTFSLPEYWP